MNLNTIIVDDFLEDPFKIREMGLNAPYPITGNFPGKRSFKCDNDYNNLIKRKFEFILNKKITDWTEHYNKETGEIENPDTSCFQLCLHNDQTWIHRDPNEFTAILFLTPNAPIDSGTGIYRHKETGVYEWFKDLVVDDIDSNAWEIITFIGNIFNRVVIFRGSLYHRSVMPGFGFDKYTGRLTQTFFFNTEEYITKE